MPAAAVAAPLGKSQLARLAATVIGKRSSKIQPKKDLIIIDMVGLRAPIKLHIKSFMLRDIINHIHLQTHTPPRQVNKFIFRI